VLAQSFANRIHKDVAGFLFEFMMVTQAMIEKIALPIHAMFSGQEFLPVPDDCLHSRFARERNDCMKVVGHEQAQSTMPEQFLVVEFHGCEHGIASAGTAQLILPGGTQLMVMKNQLPSPTHCGIV
jgi:hypothetical protein